MAETTASWPLKASAKDSEEAKSVLWTRTPEGKVWVEVRRVRAVTVKLALMSAATMAGPRLPVAFGLVSIGFADQKGKAYTDYCYGFD
jgi:hypothetical protein